MAATNKVIEFFTLNNIKKYIDYESKPNFSRELMEQILKQLREFLRKKATVIITILRESSNTKWPKRTVRESKWKTSSLISTKYTSEK